MSSTYLSLHYHFIFGTKHRVALIREDIRESLHAYLAGTVRGLDGVPQGVGGVADHVHLLVGLTSSHRVSDFMRELKKASSTWMQTEGNEPDFAWQDGYAAFTVGATSRPGVQRYIANQVQHHRRKTYRGELIELLRKAGIEFDEQYLD
jgi:REP element-mobilizing transposase RayT